MDGDKHRSIFRTWVVNHLNAERVDKTFDGAVLKFVRLKKQMRLCDAARATGLSVAQLSKFEGGSKVVSADLRNRIMKAYGYSPSSFKNLSTDPVRSKAVPLKFKLEILLGQLQEQEIEAVFRFVQNILKSRAKAPPSPSVAQVANL